MNRLFELKLLHYLVGDRYKKNKIYLALKSQAENGEKIKFYRRIFGANNFGIIYCGDD